MLQSEIKLLQHEIQQRKNSIEKLKQERDRAYREVQDFSKADSVKTDRHIKWMHNIDKQIRSLNDQIRSREAKLPKNDNQLKFS